MCNTESLCGICKRHYGQMCCFLREHPGVLQKSLISCRCVLFILVQRNWPTLKAWYSSKCWPNEDCPMTEGFVIVQCYGECIKYGFTFIPFVRLIHWGERMWSE